MSLALLLAALALAAPASPAPDEAVVAVAVENLYSAPDADSNVVSQATLGQTLQVIETSDAFARVRTPDRYEGWVPRTALLPRDPAAPRYASTGRVVEVTSLMANVYREADVTSARPRRQAPLSTRLELLGEGDGGRWLPVRLPDGATGYVQQGDVREVDPSAPRPRGSGADVVATARRFLGVPYLWGGLTAHGIDCSGLVSRVYHAQGFRLPRDANLQFESPDLRPVERADLQPGDLVFFGPDAWYITHVGLYEGEGRFINATTYQVPTVREDRLDDPHWFSAYQGARRPR
ncbi:MAG TPA: NlpC/P60 family protein [Vicinamibacteria bacterium]